MPVYLIVEIKLVTDIEKYSEYMRKVPQIIKKFGGRYLFRGGKVRVVSGNWNPSRLIIVEFDSLEGFQGWWNSPEYREIASLREEAARTNAIVVEKCDGSEL